jgi:hypothetical protein
VNFALAVLAVRAALASNCRRALFCELMVVAP